MYHGEKLNSITHLVGAVLALVGLGSLLTISIQVNKWQIITSFSIFGFTLVLLYTMSTLYHSFHPPQLKQLFRKLDHVSIYLLIAGTYTPYMMVSLWDRGGIYMLIIVWLLAFLGLMLDLLKKKRIEWLQVLIYLFMGWICTVKYKDLSIVVGKAGIFWLTLGGIAYTVGTIFYILDTMKKLRHAHGIWHLFVLCGSICHFVSIATYVR